MLRYAYKTCKNFRNVTIYFQIGVKFYIKSNSLGLKKSQDEDCSLTLCPFLLLSILPVPMSPSS